MNSIIQTDPLIKALEERAKELNCLYSIEEILNIKDIPFEELIYKLIDRIPLGFQYSEYCHTKIIIKDRAYQPTEFVETKWFISQDIKIQDEIFGKVFVYYFNEFPIVDDSPFLKEERKLIQTIADRIAHFIFFHKMKEIMGDLPLSNNFDDSAKPEWLVILEIIRKTDQNLYSILSRKMLNHMFCKGINESKELFISLGANFNFDESMSTEINQPSKKHVLQQSFKLGMEIYEVASNYFGDEELLTKIQKWIYEEKSLHLIKVLSNLNSSFNEISDALRRYYQLNPGYDVKNSPTRHGIKVSLIRRMLSDQLQYIDIAKNFIDVEDFQDLLQKMIFPPESYGKIGGKGAGIYIAQKIIEKSAQYSETLSELKTPKTWYLTSDGLMNFMYYNNMEDVIEQKYKDIDEIKQEYPHVIQAFKNSQFSLEITNGLARALDDFGDNPIIVRSSSLLEDRIGSAFAGKYKSLFLANQGTKQQKFDALLDAIAEVYASTFGPDPIGYRIEKGLLDFNEEMAIMIQEVVGTKVNDYFFPAFAGVAFTYNEFRWSPRIKREDGLIRMVPGLGTRAVDRIGDDFPILVAPGKPDLRVNQTFNEVIGYSPKNIDVLNLKTNSFETISIETLMKNVGNNYPLLNDIFSIIDGNLIRRPVGLGIDTNKHEIIATFDNLVTKSKFIEQIKMMTRELKEQLGHPVDLEFACDGKNVYILQCRPQSSSLEFNGSAIPKDLPKDDIIFTAHKHISNGIIPDIHYIVYVDPENYAAASNLEELIDVGKAVSKLNKLLPKKTFILMGPGRWGSRDDIRLGVKITYSDIHNTAVLIEIAKQKGSYTPDLSFGTHFFQDLVEANIKYIPIYPDEENSIFNKDFFFDNPNIIDRFAPDYTHVADIVKVINVREATAGKVLKILMNADEELAMAFISEYKESVSTNNQTNANQHNKFEKSFYEEPLEWRKRIADTIAKKLDPKRFGVVDIFLAGTVFHETAGLNSDIDLILHINGTKEQLKELTLWFEGWNLSLSQIIYQRTGYTIENFIDVTYVTDSIIEEQKYYADLIDPKKHLSKRLKMNTPI